MSGSDVATQVLNVPGRSLEWIERRVVQDGVVEQSFRLGRASGTVPAVLWLPPSPASSSTNNGTASACRSSLVGVLATRVAGGC